MYYPFLITGQKLKRRRRLSPQSAYEHPYGKLEIVEDDETGVNIHITDPYVLGRMTDAYSVRQIEKAKLWQPFTYGAIATYILFELLGKIK